mgnify:CR=1 FL=1
MLESTWAGEAIRFHSASNANVEASLGNLALGHTCGGKAIIVDFDAGGGVEGERIYLDLGVGEHAGR